MTAPGLRSIPTVMPSLLVDLSTSPSLLPVVTELSVSSFSVVITALKSD